MLDRHEVAYAPSGPVLALMDGVAPRETAGRALVMGDPVYPPATTAVPRGSRDPRSLGFVRLPGTRDEALGIAQRLLEAWSRATPDSGAGAVLAGARASNDVALDTPALRLCLGEEATTASSRWPTCSH